MRNANPPCFLILLFLPCLLAWDADDLALFDVVEDVNRNFYELLEITQDASSSEVRKAYRRLSLQLHPDKNKDPDAENQFRKLVSVYEILKDENLRNKYNEVLVNGLPDWRQPLYYYRKVKKMGLVDLALFLSVVLTFGHYLIMWSAYYERKFELEEVFKPKKKKDKKGKKGKQVDDDDDAVVVIPDELAHLIVKPTYSDLLPVVMAKHTIRLFTHHLPSAIITMVTSLVRRRRKKVEDDEAEEDVNDGEDSYRQRPVRNNAAPTVYEMAEGQQAINYTRQSTDTSNDTAKKDVNTSQSKSGQKWSDGELKVLVKAIVKFPGGTSERWEKIAAMVGRSPKEVMDMVKKFKSTQVMSEMNDKVVVRKGASQVTLNHVQTSTLDPAERVVAEDSEDKEEEDEEEDGERREGAGDGVTSVQNSSSSSSPPSSSSSSSQWSQQQQKCLELAMHQVDKKLTDRWDRISSMVEGKSKTECLQRVKYLSNLVKNKKKLETNNNNTVNNTTNTANNTTNTTTNTTYTTTTTNTTTKKTTNKTTNNTSK